MNHKLLLDTAVLAGEIMLCSGAETYRVEDTMYHILKTSKAESIEALALMTGIMATINSPDMEQPMTVIKAVNNRTTNLNHVIQVNDISRRYCGGELTLEETYQALRKIGGMQYNRTLCNAALVGVAAGFAMMFGGSFLDVAATAVVGVLFGRDHHAWRESEDECDYHRYFVFDRNCDTCNCNENIWNERDQHGHCNHQCNYASCSGGGDYECDP